MISTNTNTVINSVITMKMIIIIAIAITSTLIIMIKQH